MSQPDAATEDAFFDLLEGLADALEVDGNLHRANALRGCFARMTHGVWVAEAIRVLTQDLAPEHHMHGHPGHLDPFEPPEVGVLLGQILHAQSTHARHFSEFLTHYKQDVTNMSAQLDATKAAVDELIAVAKEAGTTITALEADKASLTSELDAAKAQVATLQATQTDPAGEQAIADSATAAVGELKPIVDAANPPPPVVEPAPAEEPAPVEPPVDQPVG